jgi:sugar/nucleoside kinase (ribokinase family)
MKKHDILVVGELNIDLILDRIPVFPVLGKEILADKMELVLGSSSAILASNLASLGVNVAFTGKLGKDDFGEFVLDCLKDRGVFTGFIKRDSSVKTGATIILNYPEDRAMVTHKGAMDALTLQDIPAADLQTARHMHLSSYYLQDGIRNDCPALFKMAQDAGLTTSLDTNWDPAEEWGKEIFEVLACVDVFLPNHQEAMLITGRKSVERALDELARYARTVVIKLGKEGAVGRQNDMTTRINAYRVKQVDAVGAGDSFNSGFLYKFLQGAALEECMGMGNACGALSVTKAGGTAAFQNKDQIRKDLKELLSYNLN